MNKTFLAMASATVLLSGCSNPFLKDWNTPYGTAPFSKIELSDYLPAFKEGIKQQKAEIQAIIDNQEEPSFENVVAAYELSGRLLAKVSGVFFNLSESDSTPEMQKLEEEVLPLLTAAEDEIFMNKDLFRKVKAVYDNMDGLDREQQMATKKFYERFERGGVGLEGEAEARFKEINARLSALSQQFGTNLLAENNAFKEKTGITVSEYPSFMSSCDDREARQKAFEAYSTRGNHGDSHDNCAIVLEILRLKAEQAAILGFKSSADFILDNKMAGSPETVDAFLAPIMEASMRKAKEDLADMEKIAGFKIEPWDWAYYAEKLRLQRHDLDENLTKPYFCADSVRKGVFYAAEKLYGVKVTPAPEVEVYNPDVKAYRLNDADGSLIGIFYWDWFSRSTKRGGAWMNNFRDQYLDADGKDVRPVIVNVCNFPPPTEETPSMLTVDEVQTAFHEFGHALHGFLSRCRYPSVSGTSVKRDFVEMFSQFNENWAFQKEILSEYARDYRTGEVIPEELAGKIVSALKFNQGFMTGELCAASILDMKWHELTLEQLSAFDGAESIRAFEDKVCKEMGLIDEIIPRYRTTYFNHIFNSGYSAGYYSYLWAEVLDVDAFEKFKEDGLFNPATASLFRRTFLERGGSEEPMTLYREFRGADPDPSALLKARGLE